MEEIRIRLTEPRRFIQVILGPRQVGKTTAVRQLLQEWGENSHYATADLPAPPTPAWIHQQWEVARLKARTGTVLLALDEVQKIPGWSESVKRNWDEDSMAGTGIYVVILGSSALLMQAGLTESLAGRFELIHATHWSFEECQRCFGWDIEKFIYFGGYPGAAQLVDDEQRWQQYIRDSLIETTISKDILLLNRVEKPALLRQLFMMTAEHSGEIISYQKLTGQLHGAGNTTTLAHYQHLLENAGLLCGLQKWYGRSIRRRASSPKWLVLNTALMTALAGLESREWRSKPELWGRLVESAVGAHLVNSSRGSTIEVYYWRDRNREVDFVLKKGNKVIALEVKSGRLRDDLSGLAAFASQFKGSKQLLVGRDGIPIETFLSRPTGDLF